MRAVVAVEHGVLELNYMWLPTCIGMNAVLKQAMEQELSLALNGKVFDESTLDLAHDLVVDFISKKFPEVQGIDLYLDALKYVEVRS